MQRIVQELLIGAIVGLVVGFAARIVLPTLGLTRFALPIVIGTVTGVASVLSSAPRREKIPLPRA
jgi:uncharacterized membrane protein (Fun14 family)